MSVEFILLLMIVTFAYMIGAAIGFGSSVIFMTFSVLLFPLPKMVSVVVPLNLLICIYLVGRHHDGINSRLLLMRILPAVTLGLLAGFAVFRIADTAWMKPLFGTFVIVLAGFEVRRLVYRNASVRPPMNRHASNFWLLAGGVAQGLWVSGGPILGYWAGREIANKHEFRSTLSAVWLILNIFLLIGHLVAGRINSETAIWSMELAPGVLIGIIFGEMIHSKLPEHGFRIIINVILVFAGLAILIKS